MRLIPRIYRVAYTKSLEKMSNFARFLRPVSGKSKNEQVMYYVIKRMEIAGSHRLELSYKSKCENLHGHNWIVTVYCRARTLNKDGMVIDYTHVKNKIHGYLDHGNFNELLPFNPTAENIVRWIVDQIPECYKATVQESEGNIAAYCEDDANRDIDSMSL